MESKSTREQLFENTLVLKAFAGSSNLIIEISKAHPKGAAINKTVGRTQGPITVLELIMAKDVTCLSPETFADRSKVNCNTTVDSAGIGILPKGQKLRPLVSNTSSYPCFAVPPHLNTDETVRKQQTGAETTHRKPLMGGELRVSSLGNVSIELWGDTKDLTVSVTAEPIKIGIPRGPGGFVMLAAIVGHPRFLPNTGTRQMNELVFANLNLEVLHDMDYIAATLIRALVHGQFFGQCLGLRGQMPDLKPTHKQYIIRQAYRDHLWIAIWDRQTKKPRWFELNALFAGVAGSNVGVLPMSSATSFVLSVGLKIWYGTFFDYFPTLAARILSNNTGRCVGLVFDVLGTQHSRSGKLCPMTSAELQVLGLAFDLS